MRCADLKLFAAGRQILKDLDAPHPAAPTQFMAKATHIANLCFHLKAGEASIRDGRYQSN
jgi:hypothetical protein